MVQNRLRPLLRAWHTWGVSVLLILTLEVAIRSIENAHWIRPQPSLTVVLVLAVVAGWVLSKPGLRATQSFLLALIPGAAVTVWQAAILVPAAAPGAGPFTAVKSLWQVLTTAKPDESTVYFAIFLIVLTWIIGFVSTWFLLRRHNPWVAACLGIAAMVINMENLPPGQNFSFFVFILLALLLVGASSLSKRHASLLEQGSVYPARGAAYFGVALVCLSLISVSAAWFTPVVRAEGLEKLVSKQTLLGKDFGQRIGDFLNAVPEKQHVLRNDTKGALLFGDSSFDQGTERQFLVVSDKPAYLRSTLYDVYGRFGWSVSETLEQTSRQGAPSVSAAVLAKRRDVTYTLIPQLKTDMLLTGGDFVSSDVPVTIRTLAPPAFSIDLSHPGADAGLPDDIAAAARTLRTAQKQNAQISPDGLSALLPPDLQLAPPAAGTSSASTPLSVEVFRRPVSADIAAVSSLYPLKPDLGYRVTSTVSIAAPEDLSAAGTEYPASVTDRYRQLPASLPRRVGDLAARVTADARRPYDKALAIRDYLAAQSHYLVEGQTPPQGSDGVDYFLFTSKTGNCVQFASAMTVMLRSVGVPARVAVGYAPGEVDPATGRILLTAKERHAWPEVYFAGFGWVAVEATPGIGAGIAADGAGDIASSSSGAEEPLPEDFGGGGSLGITSPGGTVSNNRGYFTFPLFVGGVLLIWFLAWFFASRRPSGPALPDYSLEVYRKMCSLASLAKLRPKPQQTPLEYKAVLTAAFPDKADTFGNIIDTYVARRYSPRKELGRSERYRLRQSWLQARRAFIKRVFRLG